MISPLLGGTLLSIVEAGGDYAIKRYALGGSSWFLGTGFGVYGLLVVILAWLFSGNGLAIVNSYWDGISNIVNMLVAAFLLNESYTFRQWAGMFLVGMGLFIIGN